MKAQCERCKEIVPLEFTVEGSAIRVKCPSCSEVYVVAGTAAAPAPTPPPPVEGGMTCPKCGAVQKPADACRKCGLVIENWKGGAEQVPAPGAATALFTKCEEDWSDAARHEAFIDHCRRAGSLAYAASRYRQRGGADEWLGRIRDLAEQTLMTQPRTAPPKRTRSEMLGIILAVFTFITFAIYLVTRL